LIHPGRIIQQETTLGRNQSSLSWPRLSRPGHVPAGPALLFSARPVELLPGWASLPPPRRAFSRSAPRAFARVGWPPRLPAGPAAGSPRLGLPRFAPASLLARLGRWPLIRLGRRPAPRLGRHAPSWALFSSAPACPGWAGLGESGLAGISPPGSLC
jgi:hypothetical protein